jgi:xanthosine utilization system XapX-like protein
MLFRFGRAFLVIGWLLSIGGVVYVVLGLRGVGGVEGASPALLLTGLVAVVVGSSLIRWVRRER